MGGFGWYRGGGEKVDGVCGEVEWWVEVDGGVLGRDEILRKGVGEMMAIGERVKGSEMKEKRKVWNSAR
ncbi:hypothetical protein, partial [Neisseria sicca]|uniref:hypothetical protein n=1 Tax=Neisseria sicca TaxID=490 RepID=UPI003F68A68E